MSSKKVSSERNYSNNFKKLSITKAGRVKNSPFKKMNGLTVKQLIKNDEKVEPKLMVDLKSLLLLSENLERVKDLKNTKVDSEYFCSYLRKNIKREKMKLLFEVLILKDIYHDNKSMKQLCEDLQYYRPDLMRSRILNFIIDSVNGVFTKESILIFLISSGLMGILLHKYGGVNTWNPFMELGNEKKSIDMRFLKRNKLVDEYTISKAFKYLPKKEFEESKSSIIFDKALKFGYNNWINYQILRRASYFLPNIANKSIKKTRQRETALDIIDTI